MFFFKFPIIKKAKNTFHSSSKIQFERRHERILSVGRQRKKTTKRTTYPKASDSLNLAYQPIYFSNQSECLEILSKAHIYSWKNFAFSSILSTLQ